MFYYTYGYQLKTFDRRIERFNRTLLQIQNEIHEHVLPVYIFVLSLRIINCVCWNRNVFFFFSYNCESTGKRRYTQYCRVKRFIILRLGDKSVYTFFNGLYSKTRQCVCVCVYGRRTTTACWFFIFFFLRSWEKYYYCPKSNSDGGGNNW